MTVRELPLCISTPGTGKTLAVVIQLPEVLLDAFRVDLFGVVTKHIGETEKNLDRASTVGLIIPLSRFARKATRPAGGGAVEGVCPLTTAFTGHVYLL